MLSMLAETTWPEVAHYAVTCGLIMFGMCVTGLCCAWLIVCHAFRQYETDKAERTDDRS